MSVSSGSCCWFDFLLTSCCRVFPCKSVSVKGWWLSPQLSVFKFFTFLSPCSLNTAIHAAVVITRYDKRLLSIEMLVKESSRGQGLRKDRHKWRQKYPMTRPWFSAEMANTAVLVLNIIAAPIPCTTRIKISIIMDMRKNSCNTANRKQTNSYRQY